jgi:hypothetical protein
LTKIVVGKNALQPDFDCANRIKRNIMQRWLTPIITDDMVTEDMYQKEQLILVGGWIANSISNRVNNDYLHYIAQNNEIYDQLGNDLGPFVIAHFRNYTIIWGYAAQDTVDATTKYIRQNCWQAPVAIASVVTVGVGVGYTLHKRSH